MVQEKDILEKRVDALFHTFDTNSSNEITKENIKFAFQKLGKEYSDEEIEVMMKSHDTNNDGKIDREEFRQII